jgi:hypothetical protein
LRAKPLLWLRGEFTSQRGVPQGGFAVTPYPLPREILEPA